MASKTWLLALYHALAREFELRYHKQHKAYPFQSKRQMERALRFKNYPATWAPKEGRSPAVTHGLRSKKHRTSEEA